MFEGVELLLRARLDQVLGETHEEVAGLVERIVEMGRRLGPTRVVCVLDQNLDGYDQGAFLGTDLAREMRRRGFEGLLIIHSANDSVDDEREYLAAGADGSVGKAVKGGSAGMLAVISRLWHQRFGIPSPLPSPQPSPNRSPRTLARERLIVPSPPSSGAPSFKSSGSGTSSFKRRERRD